MRQAAGGGGGGDKYYLRKSADRKAQSGRRFVPLIALLFVLCDFQILSGSVSHLEEPHAQSLFLFPIQFLVPFSMGRRTA